MITKKQLDTIERFADKLWAKVGLDIEFTRHFLDRVNDARNKKQITGGEIQRLFKQSFRRHGKKISALGKGAEAVIKDMETDINMPFVLQLDKNGEVDLIAKTVMRKKDFKTSNKKFTVESGAGEQGTDELSYKYKKDTPGQSSNGKNMKEKQSDKALDIKSLEKLIKSPSPRMVKMYGKSKYINMLKKKLAKLKETIEESTLNYGRTMKAIEKERKMKNISAKDKATLGKIADLMKQLKAEDAVSRAKEKADLKKKHQDEIERERDEIKSISTEAVKDFKPHMMYDPKTGKAYKANTHDDHLKMKDMGYTHEKPVDLEENRAVVYNPKLIKLFIKRVEKKFPKYKGEIQQAEKDEIVFPNDPKLIKFFKGAREVKFVLSDSVEEAVKFWKVTITKKTGKLFKGQTVDVKARNSAEAIKKGIKQMKGNPALVPSGSVDAVLGESTEIHEKLDKDDVPFVKDLIKNLRKGSKTHGKQADDLEKALNEIKEPFAVVYDGEVLGTYSKQPDSFRLKALARDNKVDVKKLKVVKTKKKQNVGSPLKEYENKETESELQEAAPFKSLEQKWLATKGDKKKQERLIKKHSLKPLISKVRPGAVKLGVLNDLDAKGSKNATAVGLDADGELIFVTNNPTKIYYAKKGSKRPKGMELEDVDLDNLRLQRMCEVALGEEDFRFLYEGFISEAGVNLTWTTSEIQKEYKKYLGNT
jgi:hypothetical protein